MFIDTKNDSVAKTRVMLRVILMFTHWFHSVLCIIVCICAWACLCYRFWW